MYWNYGAGKTIRTRNISLSCYCYRIVHIDYSFIVLVVRAPVDGAEELCMNSSCVIISFEPLHRFYTQGENRA